MRIRMQSFAWVALVSVPLVWLACGGSDGGAFMDGNPASGGAGSGGGDATGGGTSVSTGSAGTGTGMAGTNGAVGAGGAGTTGASGAAGSTGSSGSAGTSAAGGASGGGGVSGGAGQAGMAGGGTDAGLGGDGSVQCTGAHPLVDGGARFCAPGGCYCASKDACFPAGTAAACCQSQPVCASDAGGPPACMGSHPLLDAGARFCGLGQCRCVQTDACFSMSQIDRCCEGARTCF
jgi:hypothetical protein